jgi:hypothetical protein
MDHRGHDHLLHRCNQPDAETPDCLKRAAHHGRKWYHSGATPENQKTNLEQGNALIVPCPEITRDPDMPRWGQLFLLYFLSTAGLVASIFLLGDMTLFYEGMTIIGVILITNIMVVALQMHR